jgi:hypothetical protein
VDLSGGGEERIHHPHRTVVTTMLEVLGEDLG